MTGTVQVVPMTRTTFRVDESPLFMGEYFDYGDVIECSPSETEDVLRFVRVVERSALEHMQFVLAPNMFNDPKFSALTRKVEAAGGYWQRAMGGVLTIALPANSNIDVYEDLGTKRPLNLAEAVKDVDFLGVYLGMSESEVHRLLGTPEDRNDRQPLMLRYGDLQLTFEDGKLWLITTWITEFRVRILGEDCPTAWRLEIDETRDLLTDVFGAEYVDEFGHHFHGPNKVAHAVFEDGLLQKLTIRGS